MNALFLAVVIMSVMFFVVFLFECSKPMHKSRRTPVVRKASRPVVADPIMGRRFLVHLEEQMAEFLSAHHRTTAMFVIVAALLLVPRTGHAQRTQPVPAPPTEAEQPIPAAVQKQLDAMQKRIEQLETELATRRAQEQSAAEMPSHAVSEQTSGAQAPAAESALKQAEAQGSQRSPSLFRLLTSPG